MPDKNTLRVRYRTDPAWPGIVQVDCSGIATDAAQPQYWAAMRSAKGVASLVSVFNFTRAVICYRSPPKLTPGAPQQKPGAIVCLPEQYQQLARRAALLSDLGIRRAVFLSQAVALDWAASEVRLSLLISPPLQRVLSDSADQGL